MLWFDAVFLSMAMQLTIAWISIRTRAAVPVAVLFHYTSNIMGATMGTVYAGEAHAAYYAAFIGVACVIAILVSLPRGTRLPEPLAGGADPAAPERPRSEPR